MARRLAQLTSPRDLHRMSLSELQELAGEIRQVIVETTARHGGHIGASLGAVELAIALHRAFRSPEDKLIWDIGHQAYAHKLLTGRLERFATLRQHGGISGFLKRKESPHDVWEAGHASTSVSAALGFAKARDLLGQDHAVVAVIGDGALTAGLAWEGLNNAGVDGTDLIVVLNDNRMSIAPNVGAVSSYLSRLRTQPAYDFLKDELALLLKRIPKVGESVARVAEHFKDRLKYLVVPGVLFEEMGFTYLGPVDGHDLAALQTILQDARRLKGPVLIHAITQKGKGYRPAEVHADVFHGTGPFDPATGELIKKPGPPSYTGVFARTLIRLARTHPRLCAITAAMPDGTGVAEFGKEFPERTFDVGIAEQHAVTFAAGLAAGGLRPVCAIYSTFLQRGFDQVIHDVCHQNLPVIFALDRAGLVGADGETHNGIYDLAYLRHVPNMSILAPKDEDELQHALRTCVEYEGGPVAVRYPRGNGVGVPMAEEPRVLPWGKGEVLREGEDVAILAAGPIVYTALQAAEILAAEGIACAVANARFVKPLDGELIEGLARDCGAIVTVEEHLRAGGFGSAVLEHLAASPLPPVPVAVLGLPDRFIEHGDPAIYLREFGLDAEGMAAAARRLVERKGTVAAGRAGRGGER